MRLYLLLFLFCHLFCSAQFKKTEVLISELNNQQFVIDHTAKATFSFNSKAATKLIRKGVKARKELFVAINDSTKIIMVQLILCNIYFKKATFAGPKMVTENDEHVNKYFLGEENGEGLIISEKLKGDKAVYIRKEDQEKINRYWKSKLKL